jgi:hypothetical protein
MSNAKPMCLAFILVRLRSRHFVDHIKSFFESNRAQCFEIFGSLCTLDEAIIYHTTMGVDRLTKIL